MKEEIEEEFYRGLTREIKKGNEDYIERQRLLYPEREIERDWGNSLFHSFLRFDSLYTSTKKRRERRKEKRKKREREKLGEIIVSFFFVRLFVVYVEERTERERNWEEIIGSRLFVRLFVVYVEENTAREKN